MAANTLAYGFVGLEHLTTERVTDSNRSTVDTAIVQSVEEHNRQVDALLAEFAQPTTDYTVRFKQPGSGTLQPLDEWGNPLPVREEGYYDVAFPIQGGGTAWGDNRVTRALMTVMDANRQTLNSLQKDADWMKRHILAAVFDNTTWTFADPEKGNLTVQPLANADTVTFAKKSGAAATDTHYLAQAAAISDSANPFDDIYAELIEHPGNDGPIVVYVPTNLTADIMAMTGFVEIADPDIELGMNSDTVSGQLNRGFGDEVLGKVSKVWIVEWTILPDNYMIAVARGASSPPLRMRQYPAASLQGLIRENHSPDGNLNEYRFIRYAGFGAYNRTAALVYRVGNGSYAIPTGYSTPLAV